MGKGVPFMRTSGLLYRYMSEGRADKAVALQQFSDTVDTFAGIDLTPTPLDEDDDVVELPTPLSYHVPSDYNWN
jgi:hypothetical protein